MKTKTAVKTESFKEFQKKKKEKKLKLKARLVYGYTLLMSEVKK